MKIPFADPKRMTPPLAMDDLLRDYSAPFCVSPRDYHVHDGDTIMVRGPWSEDGKRSTAFSIRLNSVNAPEKPAPSLNALIMSASGMDPHWASGGAISARQAARMADKRTLMVLPRGIDDSHGAHARVNRILADVYLSGDLNPRGFATKDCKSFEHELARENLVTWRTGEERPASVLTLEVIRQARFENRQDAMRGLYG